MVKVLFINIVISIFSFQILAASENAQQILKASDRARGGVVDGLQWTALIETADGEEVTTRQFLVKAKDSDAYVESTSPAKNKGEIFIFNDRNMWFFKPSLKKPVSISSRQKLTGQAANGDIASTNYARDYNAVIEKTEILDGKKNHVLMLTAKDKSMTYDKIRYWIEDKSKLAQKAEFLTLQGKPFKIGYLKYGNKLSVNGKTVPFVSELTIIDAKFNQNKSVITYKEPQIKSLNKSIFNVNNLTR